MTATATYEIVDRYKEPGDCSALLYAPLDLTLTYRATRRYTVAWTGGEQVAVDAFMRATLLDGVSQEMHIGEDAALSGYLFALDYGMKPGALDLEKEAVLAYYRGLAEEPGFHLEQFTLRHRIYIFGDAAAQPERFVRDICNPAIHTWNVIHA